MAVRAGMYDIHSLSQAELGESFEPLRVALKQRAQVLNTSSLAVYRASDRCRKKGQVITYDEYVGTTGIPVDSETAKQLIRLQANWQQQHEARAAFLQRPRPHGRSARITAAALARVGSARFDGFVRHAVSDLLSCKSLSRLVLSAWDMDAVT
ncbi:MAG: hypothetical protein MHM6MM_003326, partial [Cercozoa sp. M6MM]